MRFRKARAGDAERLLADIRPADLVEISATQKPALEVIETSISSSACCWVAECDVRMIAVFGISTLKISDAETYSVPWLLATRHIKKEQSVFVRHGRRFLYAMQKIVPGVMYNAVHAENKAAIRWLSWLGFDVLREHPVSLNGHAFYPFFMMSE